MPRTYTAIVPTFNRPQLLRRALESVLNQTLQATEVVIVDDNEPRSRQAIESFQSIEDLLGPSVRYIPTVGRQGGARARNAGALSAEGNWLAFLDDDDRWRADYLMSVDGILSRRLQKQPRGCFVVASGYFADTAVGLKSMAPPGPMRRDVTYRLLLRDFMPPTSCLVVPAAVFVQTGGFDEALPARQDYDLSLRLLGHCALVPGPEDAVLVDWHAGRSGAISLDARKRARATIAILRKHRGLLQSRSILAYRRVRARHYARIAHRYARDKGGSIAFWSWLQRSVRLMPTQDAIRALAGFFRTVIRHVRTQNR